MTNVTCLLLSVGLSILVVGCSQEPMIHLSDEVRASIEQKTNQDKNENNIEQSLEENPEDLVEEEVSIESSQLATTFEVGEELVKEKSLVLTDYIPSKANRLKVYQVDDDQVYVYPDYIQAEQNREMISLTTEESIETKLYQWDDHQYLELGIADDSYPLNQELQTYDQTISYTLLENPLEKGTAWQSSDGIESKITNIYELAMLNNHEYNEVIEVTTYLSEGELKQYFARDVGLIYETIDDQSVVALIKMEHDYVMTHAIDIYEHISNQEYNQFSENLIWETNDSLAFIFEELFQQLGWISENVLIHSFSSVENKDVLSLDFNYLFVEDIQGHPEGAAFVIDSMLKTLTEYFNVANIEITMNGASVNPEEFTSE